MIQEDSGNRLTIQRAFAQCQISRDFLVKGGFARQFPNIVTKTITFAGQAKANYNGIVPLLSFQT